MKKLACCLFVLLIVLLLAGCDPQTSQIGCVSTQREATEHSAKQLAAAIGKNENDFTSRTANKVGNDMCEGERVAVSMMLDNAGRDSNLDSYGNRLWVVEMLDDEGNKYRVLYIYPDTVLIPDRYRN